MKFEVVESEGEWIVNRDGAEVARFHRQADALEDVAQRLRGAAPGADPVSLRLSYQAAGK